MPMRFLRARPDRAECCESNVDCPLPRVIHAGAASAGSARATRFHLSGARMRHIRFRADSDGARGFRRDDEKQRRK